MLAQFIPFLNVLGRVFVQVLVERISGMYHEKVIVRGSSRAEATLKDATKTRTVVMNTIGPVEIASHKYYDPAEKKCFMLPNEIMGFRPGERVQEDVKLELLEAATAKSYRKSAAAVTDGSVSYGTVKNIVHDRRAPELAPPEKKRKVKELFVFLDEAHVHMQPACPGAVRRCQQVPLATIAEGRQSVCKGRYTLTGRTQLVDARFTSESLLRKTEAFIHLFYDLDVLEKSMFTETEQPGSARPSTTAASMSSTCTTAITGSK